MKRIVRDGSLVVLGILIIILALWCNSAYGAWDYTPPPKPAEDIIDGLIVVPRNVLEKYGSSDRTVVMFNLVALQRACQGYEKRIKVLEDAQKEMVERLNARLKELSVDPDGVE